MAIDEKALKQLLHDIKIALGGVLNSTEKELENASEQIESVFKNDV